MSKAVDRQIQELLEQAQRGTLELIPCIRRIDPSDPVKFNQELDELRKLNGLPPASSERTVSVRIGLSKSTHARISKRAKREKIPLTTLVERIVDEAC